MIKIDEYIIEDIDELKDHFCLEKLLPMVNDIVDTDGMFLFENGDVYRHALASVINSQKTHYSVLLDGEKPEVKIADSSFVISHTPKSAFAVGNLSRNDIIALILCEMVQCAYDVLTTEAIENNEESPQIIKSGEIVRIPMSKIVKFDGQLSVHCISNPASSGYAYLIFERSNGDDGLTYQINAGTRISVLTFGNRLLNKLPQLSVSSTHVNYIVYISESCAEIRSINTVAGVSTAKSITLDATKLSQICADECGGFVALIDGEIISYSNEIQPEDIEDLMLSIPEDETIVMIQLKARQIVALTNAGNIYSNFPLNIECKNNIVWLGKTPAGEISLIYAEDFSFPENSDIITHHSNTICYNNGKID